jgi:AcrR family transcriptional regulator
VVDQQIEPVALPMAPSEPRERGDAAANRVRILQAARRLVGERGPEGLTMDAVASAAGVGKGTIFRRFVDRAGLAEALLDDDMRDFQDRFLHGPPPLGPGARAPKRLETFVVELLRLQAEDLDVALVAETAPGHRAASAFGALLFHVRTLVREIDPHLDDLVLARMILGAIAPSVIHDAHDRGIEGDVLEASAVALLRGLTPPATRHRARSGPPHHEPPRASA